MNEMPESYKLPELRPGDGKKRFRLSPKINKAGLEKLPNNFYTVEFAEITCTDNIKARRFLQRAEAEGKVKEIFPDTWEKISTPVIPKSQLLEEEVAIITEAMNLIQKLIEENRWLKAEVEKWAGIARQAKIYHNGRDER